MPRAFPGDVVCEALEALGCKAFIFGTPVVSDGETMGTKAMRYSLPSRELITDCIETMHEAYHADAIVSLGGCDKTIPASLMPLARTNAVGITLYGGSVRPGSLGARKLNGARGEPPRVVLPPLPVTLAVGHVFEAIGELGAGRIDAKQLHDIECCAVPGHGACGGMFTANTMAAALEVRARPPPPPPPPRSHPPKPAAPAHRPWAWRLPGAPPLRRWASVEP